MSAGAAATAGVLSKSSLVFSPNLWNVFFDTDHNVGLNSPTLLSNLLNRSTAYPAAKVSQFATIYPTLLTNWRNGRQGWRCETAGAPFWKALNNAGTIASWPVSNVQGTYSQMLVMDSFQAPAIADNIWRYPDYQGVSITGNLESCTFYIQGSNGAILQYAALTPSTPHNVMARTAIPPTGTPMIVLAQYNGVLGGRLRMWPHGLPVVDVTIPNVGVSNNTSREFTWGARNISSGPTEGWTGGMAAYAYSVGVVSDAVAAATLSAMSSYYNIVPSP